MIKQALQSAGLGLLVAGYAHTALAVETVQIDGSSTVFPISEAVAEEFQKDMRGKYRVTVGVSGSGGGFKKFCRGDTDISNASRPIKPSERDLCKENGIEYIELPVAMDALTVMVNPENDWVQCMTVEELKTAWEPDAQGKVTNWNQIRSDFPDRSLKLYGPGTDSGTYDYFTEAVVGEGGSSRGDFQASEDDNVLVQGIATDINALGFFGLAYFEENKDRLKAVKIENPNTEECVGPSVETAKGGSYQPLARPMFVYVNTDSADKEHVKTFINYHMDPERAPELVKEVGYVPLPAEAYRMALDVFEKRQLGTAFASGAQVGVAIEDLLDPSGKEL